MVDPSPTHGRRERAGESYGSPSRERLNREGMIAKDMSLGMRPITQAIPARRSTVSSEDLTTPKDRPTHRQQQSSTSIPQPERQMLPMPGGGQFVQQPRSVNSGRSFNSRESSEATPTRTARPGLLPSHSIDTPVAAAGSPFALTLPGGSTPRAPNGGQQTLANTLGTMQRTFSHQTDSLLNVTNRHQTALTDVQASVKDILRRLEESERTAASHRVRIEELEAELQKRKDKRDDSDDEDDDTTPTTKNQRAGISRIIREAVDYCYGVAAPVSYPTCRPGDPEWPKHTKADGSEGNDAMRWDFSRSPADKINTVQTDKLIHVLRFCRQAIPMPSDFPLAGIPLYDTHTDVYRRIISRRFRQLADKLKLQETREWTTTGRAKLLAEIEVLDEAESQDEDIAKQIDEKRTFLLRMDDAMGQVDGAVGGKRNLVRSRLQTTTAWMTKRRVLNPEYAGDEWSCLDELFCNVPLTYARDGDKVLYLTPSLEGVYSQTYIDARQKIIDTRSPMLPKGGGTKPDAFTPAHPRPVPAQPYWATRSKNMHQNPQLWMFNPKWIQDHPEEVDAYVVHVNVPTSPEEVKKSEWFLERTGKKRKYVASTPSDRDRSATPGTASVGPVGKRAKKSVVGVGRVLSDEFDDDDYERSRQSSTSMESQVQQPQAGPSRYGMTYHHAEPPYRSESSMSRSPPAQDQSRQPVQPWTQSRSPPNESQASHQQPSRSQGYSQSTYNHYVPAVMSPLSNSHRPDSPVGTVNGSSRGQQQQPDFVGASGDRPEAGSAAAPDMMNMLLDTAGMFDANFMQSMLNFDQSGMMADPPMAYNEGQSSAGVSQGHIGSSRAPGY